MTIKPLFGILVVNMIHAEDCKGPSDDELKEIERLERNRRLLNEACGPKYTPAISLWRFLHSEYLYQLIRTHKGIY